MQKLIFGALLFLSSMASAQNSESCLQQASNKELLSEISSRLSSGNGGSVSNTIITTSCSGGNFNLRTFNGDTGVKDGLSFYISSNCSALEDSLKGVANVGLTRTIIVSVCTAGKLERIAVSSTGSITTISSDYMSNSCVQTAIDANKALRP